MTIVENQVQSTLLALSQQYGDFRTKQEYGISAFWYWYYQVKQYIYNLHTHSIRYGIRNVHRIPQWGTLTYSKYKIGREILVVVHEFDYSQRNLWNWLNHKSNRRPSYSVCDTCFGFSSVLYDNSQKYGILKTDGKPLVKPIFDDIINFHHSSDDYNTLHAIGFINDRVYEITTDGNVILLHMSKNDYLNAKHKYFEAKQRRKIIENKQYNTMKNTRNKVRLTENQLHNVIRESVKKVLSELDWKTYNNAAQKRLAQGKYNSFHDLRSASEDAFNKKYGYNDEWDANLQHSGHRKVYLHGTGEDYKTPTLTADKNDTYPSLYGAYKSVGSRLNHRNNGDNVHGSHHQSCDDGYWNSNNADDFDFGPDEVFRSKYGGARREYDNYFNGNYDYEPNGRGWHLKDNMDESIRRAIRNTLK